MNENYGFIPNEIIQQILDRCDIVGVISAYFPLKRAGKNFKTTCPFHPEKTPSFIVHPEKQIFHCFGCGVGGNVISFIMQQEHCGFPDAVRLLAGKVGITIPMKQAHDNSRSLIQQEIVKINRFALDYFHHILLSDNSPDVKKARVYLKERGVSLETIKKFTLGFAHNQWDGLMGHLKKYNVNLPMMEKAGLIIARNQKEGYYDRFRNRVIFPIFDTANKCVAFGARTLEKDNTAKYINSPETAVYTKGRHLYGLNWAKDQIARQDCAIVVEGYMDFVTPYQAGVQNIVASLGTALTIEQIRLLRRYTRNIVMLFDTDEAGEAAMLRSLDLLIEEDMYVKVAKLGEDKDPDACIRAQGLEKFLDWVARADSLFDFKLKVLLNRYDAKFIEGRAKICSEILPTIHKVPNAIIKSEQMKKLSQTLAISPEALMAELRKYDAQQEGVSYRQGGNAFQPEKGKSDDRIQPVEKHLLRLMLEEPKFISLIREQTAITDFQSEYIRHVIKKIYDLMDQGVSINASTLLNFFENQSILQMLSGLMASEEDISHQREKIYRDCLSRLKQNRFKSQKQELRKKIDEATQSQDDEALKKLTLEFNQLIKR